MFATNKLIEYADCVFPVDNDSLLELTKFSTSDKA